NTGRPSGAEIEFRQALEVFQKLTDENPKVPEYRTGVALSHISVCHVLIRRGRFPEARSGYERAVAIAEPMVREHPEDLLYRTCLAQGRQGRGMSRLALGDSAGAALDVRQALGIWDGLPARSGEEWFATACCHAALAGLAGRDGSGVSSAATAS